MSVRRKAKDKGDLVAFIADTYPIDETVRRHRAAGKGKYHVRTAKRYVRFDGEAQMVYVATVRKKPEPVAP